MQNQRCWKGPLEIFGSNSLLKKTHYSRLHGKVSRLVLNISRKGDSTTSLSNLFQCFSLLNFTNKVLDSYQPLYTECKENVENVVSIQWSLTGRYGLEKTLPPWPQSSWMSFCIGSSKALGDSTASAISGMMLWKCKLVQMASLK